MNGLQRFMEAWKRNEELSKMRGGLPSHPERLRVKDGRKYIKLIDDTTIRFMVNKATGVVYLPKTRNSAGHIVCASLDKLAEKYEAGNATFPADMIPERPISKAVN